MTDLSKTCIIGDIHGCLKSLQKLLKLVEKEADTFIFLGDYIDRGSESKEVIEYILKFKKTHREVITLLGNHEIMTMTKDLRYVSRKERNIAVAHGLSYDA